MTTALIRACADRASARLIEGVQAIHAGETLIAELSFSLALQALRNLEALLDGPPPAKPLRKLVIVGTASAPHDEELPEWFETTHGEPDDGAA